MLGWLVDKIPLKAVWRSFIMVCGELCVMTAGTCMKLMWCVGSYFSPVQEKRLRLVTVRQ